MWSLSLMLSIISGWPWAVWDSYVIVLRVHISMDLAESSILYMLKLKIKPKVPLCCYVCVQPVWMGWTVNRIWVSGHWESVWHEVFFSSRFLEIHCWVFMTCIWPLRALPNSSLWPFIKPPCDPNLTSLWSASGLNFHGKPVGPSSLLESFDCCGGSNAIFRHARSNKSALVRNCPWKGPWMADWLALWATHKDGWP